MKLKKGYEDLPKGCIIPEDLTEEQIRNFNHKIFEILA